MFCGALSNAYEQLSSIAFDDTVGRLARVLVHLGRELGRPTARGTEISVRFTQEELGHMAAVSRERVSTAMNALRQRGLLDYTHHGHIMVDLARLNHHGIE